MKLNTTWLIIAAAAVTVWAATYRAGAAVLVATALTVGAVGVSLAARWIGRQDG